DPAVLLPYTRPPLRTVGAPAPSANDPTTPSLPPPPPLKSRKKFPDERFVTDKQPIIAINSILSDGQHIVQALKGGYRMTHAKGFTLVELMVTIAVAAILMAIAMPSLESISNSNALKSTTRDLVSTLSTARSQAISTRTDVLVQPAAGG